MMFYAGDGVSDLSAAKETDLLFAKRGRGEQHLLPSPSFPSHHRVNFVFILRVS